MASATDSIALSFQFSAEYLVEAMKHHRRSKTSVARLIVFKVLPTIVLVPITLTSGSQSGDTDVHRFAVTRYASISPVSGFR